MSGETIYENLQRAGVYNACAAIGRGDGRSFPIESGRRLACSQSTFWDDGGFHRAHPVPLDGPALSTVAIAAGVEALVGAGVTAAARGPRKR